MKETLNPTTDLELQSHIKVSCEIFSKIDGESSTLTGQKETLFHAFAWETEALWQFLRVLIDDMDRPLTDTVEFIDYVRDRLLEEMSDEDLKELKKRENP